MVKHFTKFNYVVMAFLIAIMLSITPLFTAASSASQTLPGNEGEFHLVQQKRIFDQQIGAQQTRNISIGGANGFPADSQVRAVVYNLTVAGATSNTYLTAYPRGIARPGTSSINTQPGAAVANQVTTRVGSYGDISVYNHAGSARVIIDVVGYYSTASGPSGMRYFDVSSHPRIRDVVLAPNTSTVVDVSSNNLNLTAGAVQVNLTATQHSGGGYISAYGYGHSSNGTSKLNFAPGRNAVANQMTIRLGSGKRFVIKNSNHSWVRILVDLRGHYYTPPVGSPSDINGFGKYVSLPAPRRMVSNASFGSSAFVTHNFESIVTGAHLPGDVRVVDANITVAGATYSGWMRANSFGVGSSTINFQPGVVAANQGNYRVDGSVSNELRFILRRSAPHPYVGSERHYIDVSGYFFH